MVSRTLRSGAAGVVLAAAALSGCSGGPPAAGAPVHIGADLELTGPGAVQGTVYQQALQLRVDQINASGVLGNRTLRLTVTDNRSDPATARRNIEAFAADGSVAAVVTGGCSECVVDAAKAIDTGRLPVISLAPATEVASPVAARRYLFKLAPNAADSAAALTAELRRGAARKVAVVHTDDLYGRGGRAAMAVELGKAGITVTGSAAVSPAGADLTATVGALLDGDSSDRPDALVVWATPEPATRIVQAARKARFTGRVHLDAAAAGPLFHAATADDTTLVHTQMLVIDTVIATSPAKVARKQWFHDYTARYGGYAAPASFGADAVQLLADAVAQGGTDREGIRRSLESAQVDGLSGPIRLTPDNHSGLMPQALSVLVARGGRWHPAG